MEWEGEGDVVLTIYMSCIPATIQSMTNSKPKGKKL